MKYPVPSLLLCCCSFYSTKIKQSSTEGFRHGNHETALKSGILERADSNLNVQGGNVGKM